MTEIRELDVRSLTEDELVGLHAFSNVLLAERRPDDPPTPLEVMRAELANLPPFVVVRQFVVYADDGSVAASAEAVVVRAEDNQHVAQVNVAVRPDHRRRGLGRSLFRKVVEAAEAEDRTLLIGTTNDRVPAGATFAERIGAQGALAQHINRLLICDVDRDLVRRWVQQGPGRAPEYRLFAVDGAYPEDQVEALVDLAHVMNTAPRGDLQVEDQKVTVEQFREFEASMTAVGDERWSLFARHQPSGELAGFTEVLWHEATPKTVHQLGTGVRPEHRRHGLGKWLKAAMLQRVLDERPGVEDVRTGNADSNEAMLAINHELGFKPFMATMTWQVPVAQVRSYVDAMT